jgi:3-oxoadipate enol-lactonase
VTTQGSGRAITSPQRSTSEKTVATNGRLDVETIGAGPDLILLHSLLSDRSSFLGFARRLAAERRVSMVNLPGFGTSPPAEPLDGYADRIAEFLDGLGPGKPDIVGNGLGSFVALKLAARHGARVGRVVLLGCAVAFPEQGRATFTALAEKVRQGGMAAVADIAMARMFPEDFIAAHPDIVAERRVVFLGIDPAAFAAAARALATLDLSSEIDRVRNPVLIVVGEKDGATPPALARDLAERLPDARFVELPGVGHAPHIHALDLLVETVGPFLGLGDTPRR